MNWNKTVLLIMLILVLISLAGYGEEAPPDPALPASDLIIPTEIKHNSVWVEGYFLATPTYNLWLASLAGYESCLVEVDLLEAIIKTDNEIEATHTRVVDGLIMQRNAVAVTGIVLTGLLVWSLISD